MTRILLGVVAVVNFVMANQAAVELQDKLSQDRALKILVLLLCATQYRN